MRKTSYFLVGLFCLFSTAGAVMAAELPSHSEVQEALRSIVKEKNGGFGFNMWATVVNRDGVVTLVSFSGEERGDQWPGSRLISAQKANTANAFSLPGLSLSTANLFSAVQPGGSLYSLQHSNPVNTTVAYSGKSSDVGTSKDPMLGKKIGGVNVFGGGLALYAKDGSLLGALGVSGDNSCADHNIAWKLRHTLELDYIPGGVSPEKNDNIVNDIVKGTSASGWGHPVCTPMSAEIAKGLTKSHPLRVVENKH